MTCSRHAVTKAPGSCAWLVVALAWLPACKSSEPEAKAESRQSPGADDEESQLVGYDLRRLRPRNEERLADMFERLHADAVAEGKQVAVLFSADWCEPCRHLELELGNMHPAEKISHMRILELKEEDWQAVTRMNEFNNLRRRWYPPLNSYPVFVVLDANGNKVEEMKEAIERLREGGHDEPTVATWFHSIAKGEGPKSSEPPA